MFKGRCWSKNCFANFSTHSFHCTFNMISIKKYGEKTKLFFSRASFPWKLRPARHKISSIIITSMGMTYSCRLSLRDAAAVVENGVESDTTTSSSSFLLSFCLCMLTASRTAHVFCCWLFRVRFAVGTYMFCTAPNSC